ncbi:MAG: Undecaprenyl-diphosphatase [Vampirovibrio sp.]|jgi:undecaprenyl-diphosphatase|nr:Undecaprenyl-diphosphatase [Vampirovibrio sp.]
MDLLHSIILGIVEGITEFLPISSTGHMILTSYLLNIKGEVVNAFEVFIQLGAILAVVFLYRQRFACLFNFKSNNGFSGFRGLSLLAVTSLPILVTGKILEHTIKTHLFNPVTVTWALAIGGVILILVERFRFKHSVASIDEISYKDAFRIGLCQCFALCPGVSRAASTIIGGMANGLNRTTAAEYSFLAAVPIMFIVCLKDLAEIWHQLSPNDITVFAVGFVVAFISALFAVKTFIHLLQRSSLGPFGVYRIIVAIIFFALLSNQTL